MRLKREYDGLYMDTDFFQFLSTSTQPASSLHHPPQLSQDQRPSRGRGKFAKSSLNGVSESFDDIQTDQKGKLLQH